MWLLDRKACQSRYFHFSSCMLSDTVEYELALFIVSVLWLWKYFFFVFISHVVCLDGVHIPVVAHYVMRVQMLRGWLSIAGNWKINLSVILHQSLRRKFHMQIFTWISPPTSLREAVRHLLFCDWPRPLYLFIKRMISSRHPQRWAQDISHASFNGQIILAGFW